MDLFKEINKAYASGDGEAIKKVNSKLNEELVQARCFLRELGLMVRYVNELKLVASDITEKMEEFVSSMEEIEALDKKCDTLNKRLNALGEEKEKEKEDQEEDEEPYW